MTPPSAVFAFSRSERSLLILAKHIVMISTKFLLFSLAKLVRFHFVTSSTAAATVVVEAVMINTVDRSPEAVDFVGCQIGTVVIMLMDIIHFFLFL